MRSKKIKKILTNSIIVLLVCSAAVYAALHVRISEPAAEEPQQPVENEIPIPEEPKFTPPKPDPDYEGVDFNLGDYLYKDIYINGYHINNWEITYPFVKVEDQFYAPASECILAALGLDIQFDDASHWVRFSSTGNPTMDYVKEGKCACNLMYKEVYWGHQYWFGEEEAPANYAVTTKESEGSERMLYLSMDALKKYSGLEFSYYYDDISGLYLSTEAEHPAESYFSQNNQNYIEGRARHMVYINKKLAYEDALFYEYIFRHEASQSKYLYEDLLIGMCRYESCFKPKAGTKAIGLLQILYKYAELQDYSEEMLMDPHYNVEYGATVLAKRFESCKGDEKMALAAYNAGLGSVQRQIRETGTFKTGYANKCINYKDVLQSWVKSNGYSNKFNEYVGQ